LILGVTNFQALVRRRFKYSLLWSTAAKVTTCLLQVISIPIAIGLLGKEGYVAYAAIYAISLAPQAFVLRHGPSLTGPNAILFAQNEWDRIRRNLWAAVIPSGASAFLAGLGLALFFHLGWLDIPAGLAATPDESYLQTLIVLVLVNLFHTWVLAFDDMQAAFQETHVQGIRVTLGNVVALIAIMTLVPQWPTVLVYAMAITVPPLVFRLGNVGLMMVRYRQLIPQDDSFNRVLLHETTRKSLMFTLVVGVGTYAAFRLPVIASAEYLGIDQTTSISIINQFVLVGYVFGSVLSVAFVPAINASIAEGDANWILRSIRRMECFMTIAAVVGTATMILMGGLVHRYFVKESLHVPASCLLFAGTYTSLLVIENFYFLVGISFQSSKRLNLLFVTRAIITGAFAFVACALDFPAGIWLSGTILTLVMTVFPYRYAVNSHLRRVTRVAIENDSQPLRIAPSTE